MKSVVYCGLSSGDMVDFNLSYIAAIDRSISSAQRQRIKVLKNRPYINRPLHSLALWICFIKPISGIHATPDEVRRSMRSIENFDILLNAVSQASYLQAFNGHPGRASSQVIVLSGEYSVSFDSPPLRQVHFSNACLV